MDELAQRFSTPLYVYDGEKISQQIRVLKQAFAPVKHKIKYAVKALTNLSVLNLMNQQGVGADVVSIFRTQLALKAVYPNWYYVHAMAWRNEIQRRRCAGFVGQCW